MKKLLGILVLSLLFSNEEIAAKNIKFSRMIVPSEDNTYNVKISIVEDQEKYNIRAIISQNDDAYFKLNAEYKTK